VTAEVIRLVFAVSAAAVLGFVPSKALGQIDPFL